MMIRTAAICALALGVTACGDGNPFGNETDGDDAVGSVYLDQSDTLVVNNISYDEGTDTLTINNIPFDDGNNEYVRITTENFGNGFDAYQSDPAPGSNENQYFAIFRRSDSGNTQVAASTSAAYIGFGFGGAGAQRLGATPNLPTSGVYSYSGEYGAVRTVLSPQGNGSRVEYVTGDAEMAADFGDFDNIGAVDGQIYNRVVYDDTGQATGVITGIISMANGEIDFATGTIASSFAVALDGSGNNVGNGNWQGVLAGPNGEEVAGVVFIDGTMVDEQPDGSLTSVQVREIGGFVATR